VWICPFNCDFLTCKCAADHTFVFASPSDNVSDIFPKIDAAVRPASQDSLSTPWTAKTSERRLILGGCQLKVEAGTLGEQGVRNGCTIFEVGRLAGGGCDGGTTALQRKFMSQVRQLSAVKEPHAFVSYPAKILLFCLARIQKRVHQFCVIDCEPCLDRDRRRLKRRT
jgi:hypothetical protein